MAKFLRFLVVLALFAVGFPSFAWAMNTADGHHPAMTGLASAATPELSAWALLFAGGGLLVSVVRHRHRKDRAGRD